MIIRQKEKNNVNIGDGGSAAHAADGGDNLSKHNNATQLDDTNINCIRWVHLQTVAATCG